MRRIPTNKERKRKAQKKGGFDDSYIDKEYIKRLEEMHDTCYWCKDKMYAIVDKVHSDGLITMSCSTPGCPGNVDTTKVDVNPLMKNKYARYVDGGDLCMDFAKLLSGRSPSNLWATKKFTIDPLA